MRKALRIKINEQKKHLNHLPKADTTRATATSGEAGARNSPDKSQEWDLSVQRLWTSLYSILATRSSFQYLDIGETKDIAPQ